MAQRGSSDLHSSYKKAHRGDHQSAEIKLRTAILEKVRIHQVTKIKIYELRRKYPSRRLKLISGEIHEGAGGGENLYRRDESPNFGFHSEYLSERSKEIRRY